MKDISLFADTFVVLVIPTIFPLVTIGDVSIATSAAVGAHSFFDTFPALLFVPFLAKAFIIPVYPSLLHPFAPSIQVITFPTTVATCEKFVHKFSNNSLC